MHRRHAIGDRAAKGISVVAGVVDIRKDRFQDTSPASPPTTPTGARRPASTPTARPPPSPTICAGGLLAAPRPGASPAVRPARPPHPRVALSRLIILRPHLPRCPTPHRDSRQPGQSRHLYPGCGRQPMRSAIQTKLDTSMINCFVHASAQRASTKSSDPLGSSPLRATSAD